ncbi:atypical chemokine receptor 2 [Amia ocellicauda]|uniref:atypical chemokine receptor 2 n=1 Tax=Amia ocellicauda TaxID=2972642 RepID=UPI0034643892
MADLSALNNDSQDEHDDMYDYSYYNEYLENGNHLHNYGVCEKGHVKAFARVFLPVLYTSVFVLGMVGNGLLAGILIRYIKLKRMVDIYLLNLAVSDLLFVVTLPFWAVYAHSEWIFGSTTCKAVTLIYTMNLYSSIFFITCISLDRYLEFVWSFHTINLRKLPVSCAICAAVWTVSALASAPDVIFTELQEFRDHKLCLHNFGGEHMSWWKIFMKFELNIVGFFIPFLAMLFFYSRISCVITRAKLHRGTKSLKLAIALVVFFFVLWFPYNLVVFLHSLQDLHVISHCTTSQHLDFAIQVTESLAFVHACLNPILYAFVNKKFQHHLMSMLKMICRRGREYSLEHEGHSSTQNTVTDLSGGGNALVCVSVLPILPIDPEIGLVQQNSGL